MADPLRTRPRLSQPCPRSAPLRSRLCRSPPFPAEQSRRSRPRGWRLSGGSTLSPPRAPDVSAGSCPQTKPKRRRSIRGKGRQRDAVSPSHPSAGAGPQNPLRSPCPPSSPPARAPHRPSHRGQVPAAAPAPAPTCGPSQGSPGGSAWGGRGRRGRGPERGPGRGPGAGPARGAAALGAAAARGSGGAELPAGWAGAAGGPAGMGGGCEPRGRPASPSAQPRSPRPPPVPSRRAEPGSGPRQAHLGLNAARSLRGLRGQEPPGRCGATRRDETEPVSRFGTTARAWKAAPAACSDRLNALVA